MFLKPPLFVDNERVLKASFNFVQAQRSFFPEKRYDTNFTVMAPSSPAGKWGLEGTLRNGDKMTELFTADHYNRLLMNCFRRFACPKQRAKEVCC